MAEPRRGPEPPDISEKGGMKDGQPQRSNERLFMQFMALGGCANATPLADTLARAKISGVLYEDLNDPRGVGLLTFSDDPDFFLDRVRPVLNGPGFSTLVQKPHYTMLGRTYAIGYEQDLEETLVERPRRRVLDPGLPWAIWYPLRRAGSFEQLSRRDQDTILMEHGGVGMAFGRAGLGFDIRLACHGLDREDNDFVVGLLGPELHPLSIIVQRMRKTKQTSLHLERLGPFFVGRVAWQSSP